MKLNFDKFCLSSVKSTSNATHFLFKDTSSKSPRVLAIKETYQNDFSQHLHIMTIMTLFHAYEAAPQARFRAMSRDMHEKQRFYP